MPDEITMEAQQTKAIEEWFGLLGSLGFVAAICLLGYQTFLWLKEGQWTPMPISSIFGILGFDYYSVIDVSWAGVQKILIWLLDLPLSLGLIVFGCVVGVVVGNVVHQVSMLRNAS
jgi:hypothetical protein